ncbi:MAG TPA: thioesterase, partial [bacterium]|nr:thioesterase [bacterium]
SNEPSRYTMGENIEMEFNTFSTDVKVGYNQVDSSGHLKALSAIQLLEEAAIENCSSIDRNVFTLLQEGYGWVLRGGAIQYIRYPSYADSLIIKTWISKWTILQGFREFVVLDSRKETCVRATTGWAFIDVNKRRPVPIPDVFKEKWAYCQEKAFAAPLLKRPLPISEKFISEAFHIRRTDIDSNKHVHNVRYAEWVLETIPIEYDVKYQMESLEGAFLQEARFEDLIEVRVEKVNETELIHNVIRKGDNAVLTTGHSRWQKKQAD